MGDALGAVEPRLALPQCGLRLLQFGDVDAQARDAAAPHAPLRDQHDPTVAQPLLEHAVRLEMPPEPLGDPVGLVSGAFADLAVRYAEAQDLLEGGTDPKP